MPSHNTLLDLFISPLNQIGVKYMITGSVASICYGEPRLTHDIDMVLLLTLGDLKAFEDAFPDSDYYLPPTDVIVSEMRRSTRGHFNIIHLHSALKADVYFTGDDPTQIWGLKNRKEWSIDETRFFLAPPEYVIVMKMRYWGEGGHNKHLDDIRAMLETIGDEIQLDEIRCRLSSDLRRSFDELLPSS